MLFEWFRIYFLGVCRAIIWTVVLAVLLLGAYCAIRFLDMALEHVNKEWFSGHDEVWLLVSAVTIMLSGLLIMAFRGRRQARNRRHRSNHDESPPPPPSSPVIR